MSQGDEPSRKRAPTRQLTERDDVDDEVEEGDGGTWQKADATVMQTRKIARVRGKSNSGPIVAPETAPAPAPEAAPAATAPKFSFASFSQPKPEEKKEEAKVTTPEKAPQEPANGTAKEATPVKEATPAKETTTPTKETPASPAKETTPTKETPATLAKETTPTKETESKESTSTPSKETTPVKTDGIPEAPKFSFPTTFAFPTSFTATPFSFPTLSSTTTPAFSSTSTTPAFSGFNFPSVNFSAGGSSVFSAGGAKKEGSDDEADEANPEEEVAITGPNAMPIVATLTGEEEETTLYNVRAKLFALVEGTWQERGVGQVKLNQGKDGKCRLVMRDQGGKHLRLNAALFTEMKVDKPNEKSVQFVAVGNGGSEAAAVAGATPAPVRPFTTFALRVGRKEDATELFEAINKHKSSSASSTTTATSST